MRLLTLSARNFRGFGAEPVDVPIGSDLVLFYGPNGYGKTSLAEAVEWLFYGVTKRRERGEAFSRLEYAGTYGNVHGGRPVEVAARVRLLDGAEHVLTRRLRDSSEASITLVDGVVAEFSSLNVLVSGAVYPVVAQHSLQSFIHTKPKERRDAMSEALGLQELAALKTALDGARRSFQASPPSSVSEARREIAGYASVFALKPELQDVARRWRQLTPVVSLPEDLTRILEQIKQLTESASDDPEILLPLLRNRRADASRAIFDSQKLAPKAGVSDIGTDFAAKGKAESEAFLVLSDAVTALLHASLTTFSRELLSLWQIGLPLVGSNDECPMCEHSTLTSEQRERLRQRLLNNESFLKAQQVFSDKLRAAKGATALICDSLSSGRLDPMESRQRDVLKGIMVGYENAVDDFLAIRDSVIELFQAFDGRRGEIEAVFDAIATKSLDVEVLPGILAQLKNARAALLEAAQSAIAAVTTYSRAWPEMEKLLANRIANTQLITFIDALGKALKHRHLLRRLVRYDEILQTSKLLMQDAEETLQQKQDDILGVRGSEVVDIYRKLNPGADVGFESMEPGTDHLKLHATSFGRRMSAAANLSQCQLNCLGLAVWLMQATTPASPFGFIVLDDPVQSMDDDHYEAFITSLVPFLLDQHKKQVILLSHLRPVIDRIRNLNTDRDMRLYHLESYGVQGPTIVEQSEFAKLLAEIKGLADGNEDNRILAVDRLRVLVEKFIRAVHVKNAGTPAHPDYDQAQAAELLKLFLRIPGTTQRDHAGLYDTVNFAHPAHHSDAGYTPPLKSNIQPHIDRMTTLIKKYDLR